METLALSLVEIYGRPSEQTIDAWKGLYEQALLEGMITQEEYSKLVRKLVYGLPS